MQVLLIVALCIGAAVLYGVVHDQVTARICLEYFTIAHPKVIDSQDPSLIALVWGIIATWWVGLMLGIPLGLSSQAGERTKISAKQQLIPLAILLLAMAAGAATLGYVGYSQSESGAIELLEPLRSQIAAEKHSAFIADAWAHMASYGIGLAGGLVLIMVTWFRRKPIVT